RCMRLLRTWCWLRPETAPHAKKGGAQTAHAIEQTALELASNATSAANRVLARNHPQNLWITMCVRPCGPPGDSRPACLCGRPPIFCADDEKFISRPKWT